METFSLCNTDSREVPTLIRGEEAARIADEYTIAPSLLRGIVCEIDSAYRNGFKELDNLYYLNENHKSVDEAVKYVEKFLTERNYLCDFRIMGNKIYYNIKWPAVPDSQ